VRRREDVGQAPFEKPFFVLNGGLNTEVSPLNAPEGVTVDEENMEIMRDGSRRRRRAIADETGGVRFDTSEVNDLGAFARTNVFQWESPGGDTSATIQVVKLGGTVHFYDDSETLSANKRTFTISLMDWATTDEINDVIGQPVTFASHQGVLFISGKYVSPLYVELVDGSLQITEIPLRVRDFSGIPDEVALNVKPTTLTSSHEYNLLNRGWKTGSATTDGYLRFFADTGYYPAKNMIPWMGYSKKAESGKNISNSEFNPSDWTKSYSSSKLEAEVFGEASAPQGHILINPFNTSYGTIGSGLGAQDATVTLLESEWDTTGFIKVTMTLPLPHSIVPGDQVEVTGGYVTWYDGPGDVGGTVEMTGVYDARPGTTGATLVIRIPVAKFVYNNAYDNPGLMTWTGPTTAGTDPILNEVTGVVTDLRPTAIAFFAGRIWYAGLDSAPFTDTVMFSQIVLNSVTDYEKYGRCYQAGDPTDEFRSMVVPSDGGTIQVPGLSGVRALVPLQNSILVMSATGVYEITGGRAPFSANNFSVRKLSDVDCLSAAGIARTDFGIAYTSSRGLYTIITSETTGLLTSNPMIDATLRTYWNALPDGVQAEVQIVYDYALQKLYVLHGWDYDGTFHRDRYERALVFDVRNSGWYPISLPYPVSNLGIWIKGALITRAGDGANDNKKVKFIASVQDIGVSAVAIMDMDHTFYYDADGRQPIPYLITAYDGIGGAEVPKDFAHKRQAPVVHVYSRRTETGVDGNGALVNSSSVFVEPRWDFTDTNLTGRASAPQQAYRTQSMFLGSPTDNGQPVVISRLKVRGRGKSLHFKFYGEADKDFHLLGYAIYYKIGRRV
jgi:hypothetical protein